MKLEPPVEKYITGSKPSHSAQSKLSEHINFLSQDEIFETLQKAGYLGPNRKTTKAAVSKGLVDVCDKKLLWNLKKTKLELLELTKKESKKKEVKAIIPQARPKNTGPVWTDLENIGTYFGVGKNKIGKWLDELGLRGYKPVQVNESGDVDMLDIANQSKEKFKVKVPTELALERGFAQVETIEYTQKGKVKSFEKYSWNLEMVKAVLVKNGHELDLERKLLLKGKGKNSDVKVDSIDERAKNLYHEWKKLYSNPKTRDTSWKVFDKQPSGLLMRVEMLMGRPRYLRDKVYLKEK